MFNINPTHRQDLVNSIVILCSFCLEYVMIPKTNDKIAWVGIPEEKKSYMDSMISSIGGNKCVYLDVCLIVLKMKSSSVEYLDHMKENGCFNNSPEMK